MPKIEEIERIEEREFGFVFAVGSEKIMKRKLKFHSQDELEYFIKTHDPLDCYVSVAFYTFPTAMEGWQGSVLFFDFDSKDNLRLAAADAETAYEVLLDDFGLEKVDMRFSGSKGYHVIVHDEEPRMLGTAERREIVDYLVLKYGVQTLDEAASCDTRRLRRIYNTVNSKSGKRCILIKKSY